MVIYNLVKYSIALVYLKNAVLAKQIFLLLLLSSTFVFQVKGLLSLSWTVQGKYQALTQLVPIIGTPAVLQVFESTILLS